MSEIWTLAAASQHELIVRKSRFIACVEPVGGREEALRRVTALRVAHPGASHVCWALHAGGQSAAVDDGEPSGTAGQPMLRVLRHQHLDGVLATVVRYFGGVKLGAGGLMRAYTDAVAQALLMAHKVEMQRMCRLRCSFPYALEGLVRRELELLGSPALFSHSEEVEAEWELAESAVRGLVERLDEAGQGALHWLPVTDEG